MGGQHLIRICIVYSFRTDGNNPPRFGHVYFIVSGSVFASITTY